MSFFAARWWTTAQKLLQGPYVISQPRRHSGSPRSPNPTVSHRTTEPDSQGMVGAHEIVNCILEVDVVLQRVLPLGERQRLAHQPPVVLARCQVIAFHVRGVDPGAATFGLQNPDKIILGAEQDLPLDFDHVS